MLIAMVLDRPLSEAQTLVENPETFFDEMTKVLSEKRNHPVLKQMLQETQSTNPPLREGATSSTDIPHRFIASQQDQFQ